MSLKLGPNSYREGAEERLEDARRMLRLQRFGAAIYLAGRAVEGMLRGVVWKKDPDMMRGSKSLEAGHDLRQLLTMVRRLGLLHAGGRDVQFMANVQHVARLWANNMRFAASARVEGHWKKLGEVSGRRNMSKATNDY
jgi:hypothetical protein